jgi:hypothetical protein
MSTCIAKYVDQDIRRTIDNLWLLDEIGAAVDHGEQLDPAFDPVKVTVQGDLGMGNQFKGRVAGSFITFLKRQVLANNAGHKAAVGPDRPLACDKKKVSPDLPTQIIGGRGEGRGQGDAEFSQTCVNFSTHGTTPASGDFEDGVDFDGYTTRQGTGTNSKAGMATRIPENLDQQVGSTVDDFRLLCEVVSRIDETTQFHTAGYSVQVAITGSLDLGNDIQGTGTGSFGGGGNINIITNFAEEFYLSVHHRDLP